MIHLSLMRRVKQMNKVFLSVGHGGNDSGAIGTNGIKEKDYTLLLCKEISKKKENIRFDIKNKEDSRIFKIEIKSIVNNDIFLRYVMICKDVTNTYEIIEELQNSQDMMANREKFATLGQLISRNCTFFKVSNFFYIWRIRGIK